MKHWTALAVMVIMCACEDTTGVEDRSLAGRYTVTLINGTPPPVALRSSTMISFVVHGGVLQLAPAGTFADTVVMGNYRHAVLLSCAVHVRNGTWTERSTLAGRGVILMHDAGSDTLGFSGGSVERPYVTERDTVVFSLEDREQPAPLQTSCFDFGQ